MSEHKYRLPEGKMTPGALASDLIYVWDKESISAKVSANGCLKLEVNLIELWENCADNANRGFLQSF